MRASPPSLPPMRSPVYRTIDSPTASTGYLAVHHRNYDFDFWTSPLNQEVRESPGLWWLRGVDTEPRILDVRYEDKRAGGSGASSILPFAELIYRFTIQAKSSSLQFPYRNELIAIAIDPPHLLCSPRIWPHSLS